MRALMLCHRLDTRLLVWTLQHRHRTPCTLWARWTSHSGDGYVQLATLMLAWLHGGADMRAFALRCAWLLVLERVSYAILKNGLRRRRPPECVPEFTSLVVASDRFSFPSGHTSAAFLLATLLFDLSPEAGFVAFGWAATVGLSRVVLGVHFPSDILAGATLGIAVGAITLPPPATWQLLLEVPAASLPLLPMP